MASVEVETYIARWNGALPGKEWRRRGRATVVVGDGFGGGGPTPDPEQLHAGHVPNRVLIGMASPDNSFPGPGWSDALDIIGQPIYEARRFSSGWITTGNFNSMIADAVEASALPVISFKIPSNDWAGVYAKTYDSDLVTLFNLVQANGNPIVCSFHHEPAGDGTLTVWAKMQLYCAYWFAGYRSCSFSGSSISTFVPGSYNAAHDLSLNNGGNLSWGPIGNGFWWRNMSSSSLAQNRADAWPPELIAALNLHKGIVLNDFYDTDYIDQTAALTDPAYRLVGTGVRTSTRIANFCNWARSNGVNTSGAGEWGCIDDLDMYDTWDVMAANRDIWSIGNYFNSAFNSDHDWRLVPADYPDTSYVSSKGFVDFGGNAQSAGRLAAFQTILTESTDPTHTGPL